MKPEYLVMEEVIKMLVMNKQFKQSVQIMELLTCR